MSESLRESISALVDDEAQELELHRVLASMEEDEDKELRHTWRRYQAASFAMRRQVDCRFDMDISDRVSAALADEPAVEVEQTAEKSGLARVFKPALSMAVAASAAFLVIFAVQLGGEGEIAEQVAAGDQPLTTNLVAGAEIASENLIAVSSEVMTPVEKRLQSLIENHTQQASMSESRGVMPHTQLVESQDAQGY
ncbi:Sigma factor RpoE negative regulatory protein RseA [gamma proteobacterium IMCC2047]|nr:Sigma factor RpoE negative regulatory protein RseA [gamma proteobacterium IMCC2047]